MAVSIKSDKFTLENLRPGQVVVLRDGEVRMVMEIGVRGSYILLRDDGVWNYLSNWNHDLTANIHATDCPLLAEAIELSKQKDIIAVYGHINVASNYFKALAISIDSRPVLWSRKVLKEMTLAEIEKTLGYEVKIVKEK